mgnify:CR=1 FL=1
MWDVDAVDVVFDGQYVRLSDERAAREQNRYLTLRDFANLCVKNIAAATRSPRMLLPACPFRLRRLWPALPRSRSIRLPAR